MNTIDCHHFQRHPYIHPHIAERILITGMIDNITATTLDRNIFNLNFFSNPSEIGRKCASQTKKNIINKAQFICIFKSSFYSKQIKNCHE